MRSFVLPLFLVVSSSALAQGAATSTSLTASPASPYEGQQFTVTALVTATSPTNVVQFRDSAGATVAQAPVVSGQAVTTLTYAAPGSVTLRGIYVGDANNAPTETAAAQPLTITIRPKNPTTLNCTANVATTTVPNSITLTATVVGAATTTGTVALYEGTTMLGLFTQNTANKSLFTKSIASPVGTRTFTAKYSGTVTDAPSTAPAVNLQWLNSSATTLNADLITSAAGQVVTLTASVSGVPTGPYTFTFKEGAQVIGSSTSVTPVTTLATSFSALGSHTITASFAGNATYAASSASIVLKVIVVPPVSQSPETWFEYDAMNNPTKMTSGSGPTALSSSAQYDAHSRLSLATDARNNVVQYGFDLADRRDYVVDTRNNITEYPHNGVGEEQLISPDTGAQSNTYNPVHATQSIDARGATKAIVTDALNRVTSVTATLGAQAQVNTIRYDEVGAGFSHGIGRLTSTENEDSTSRFAYDPHGNRVSDTQRIKAKVGANPADFVRTVSYGYNSSNSVTTIVYPSGLVATYDYAAGLPTAVSVIDGATTRPIVQQLQFSAAGKLTGWRWNYTAAQPQVTQRFFDTHGRITRYQLGTLVRDVTYDSNDRISSYTHIDTMGPPATQFNSTFTYDGTGNLLSATVGATTLTYNYDANGNRILSPPVGSSPPSVVTISPSSNRLQSTTNPPRTFTYDAAGNTLSNGVFTMTYDAMSRLRTASVGTTTTSYDYDVQGRRVRKFSPAGTTLFVYDLNDQLLGEYSATGAPLREYVWLGDMLVAIVQPGTPRSIWYVHVDHLNTPRVVTNSQTPSSVAWRWLGDPFGQMPPTMGQFGAFTFNLRFPGQYFDSETGLFYNLNRNYDPALGRYLESDPLGLEAGMNTYAYVDNNPVNFVDPSGLTKLRVGSGPYPVTPSQGMLNQQGALLVRQIREIRPGFSTIGPGNTFAPEAVRALEFELQMLRAVRNAPRASVSWESGASGINPTSCRANCVNCGIATARTMAGRPTYARPSDARSIRDLERELNRPFSRPLRTSQELIQEILTGGANAQGVVSAYKGPTQRGHVFNYQAQQGSVRFPDGQNGGFAETQGQGYQWFRIIRTDDLIFGP